MNKLLLLFLLISTMLPAQDQFLLKDLNPGVAGSDPHNFVSPNGFMYFIANDGVTNRLWQCNAIRTGTMLVSSDIYEVSELTIIDNFIYFSGEDVLGDRHLYITDGIIGNPINVISTNASGNSNPSNIIKASDNRVYFYADTPSNGRQLHSITGNNGSTLEVHLPATSPYINGMDFWQDIHYNGFDIYFGNKGLVVAGDYLFYYVLNPITSEIDLWSMDFLAPTPVPNLITTNLAVSFKIPPHGYNGNAYIIDGVDLNFSDGVNYFVLTNGILANSLTNMSGRMYFSGLESGGSTNVLYDLDASNVLTEHSIIKAEQPGGGFNPRGVLKMTDNKLYAWRSTGTQGMYEIDISNPAFPTDQLVFTKIPYNMEDIFPYGNLYFFAVVNAPTFSVYRAYATGGENITNPSVGADAEPKGFFFYFGSLFFADSVPSTNIVDCNSPGTYGKELFKLTDSQLGCNNSIFYNNAFFQDGIYASKTSLDVNPVSIAVANTCTILSSPTITLNGITINGQFQTINDGCK